MNLRRLSVLAVALALLLPAAATAAPAPSLLAGPCLAGGSYDPACDVDRDNDVDIFDIQLTASRWNTNGVWTADGWSLTGNAGTTSANFLGTTDNKSLELRVNGTNALRILPGSGGRHTLVGGHSDNAVWAGVLGGTISGGQQNTASGLAATVAGGFENTAAGDYSFAAGRRARANHEGAFVLADSNDFNLASTVTNSLRARFTGGMRMIVGIDGSGNYTVNCLLSQGTGSWACSNSLAAMESVQAADSRDILDRVSQVPVLTWQAGAEGVRHIGPAEEGFHAAFGLGLPGEGISTIDLDGVALASIQALYQMAQEKDAQIAALEKQIDGQQGQIDALLTRLAALEEAATGATR